MEDPSVVGSPGVDRAMGLFARAAKKGNASASRIVRSLAPVFAAAGRLDQLGKLLAGLPESWIAGDPHLSYWKGTTILLENPGDAEPYLLRAFDALREQPGSMALLSFAGVLDAIFLSYRDLRQLDEYLVWMTPEREAAVDRLHAFLKSVVVASMLFVLVFRAPLHPRLPAWRERARRIAEANPVSELGSRIVAGLIIDCLWRGNLAEAGTLRARFEARAAKFTLAPAPECMRHVNAATLLLHEGRLGDCAQAVATGLAAAHTHEVHLWDGLLHCHGAAAALSQGEPPRAAVHLQAIEQLFASGHQVDEAYYRAMLAWHAFAIGDHVGARARCDNALEVTDAKGVPYLMAVCRVSSGLVLFEAGQRSDGRLLLETGLRLGQEIANPVIAWIGGLFAAHMAFSDGASTQGETALRDALSIGSEYSLMHFFCWPRDIIASLLDRAFTLGQYDDYLTRLAALHAIRPGKVPALSDQWAFTVRVHTFGSPRVLRKGEAPEALSQQFLRQVELLSALIEQGPQPVPLASLARAIYADDHVDPSTSLKRILHSLRERIGTASIVQRDAALSVDFTFVWIDAASLAALRASGSETKEVLRWLDRYYLGHFMDRIEGSPLIAHVRARLAAYVERIVSAALSESLKFADHERAERLEIRWCNLFPKLFSAKA